MGQIYIIPDIQEPEKSMSLINEYGASFEYNDFWKPETLDDRYLQEKIIENYAKYRTDFSKDTMHGAFLDVCIHSQDPLIRDVSVKRVYQSMDIAKRMGLRGVVFHTGLLGGYRVSSYLEHWKQSNKRFFTELVDKYPEQKIFMENMFDEVPDELAELADEMKEIENFAVCLDYAHSAVTKCPSEKWVQALAPYMRHMHINDNDLRGDLHQPLGEGQIDWEEFDRLMKKYKADPTVLVEVRGFEAQKKSLEYLKENHLFPLKSQSEVLS